MVNKIGLSQQAIDLVYSYNDRNFVEWIYDRRNRHVRRLIRNNIANSDLNVIFQLHGIYRNEINNNVQINTTINILNNQLNIASNNTSNTPSL